MAGPDDRDDGPKEGNAPPAFRQILVRRPQGARVSIPDMVSVRASMSGEAPGAVGIVEPLATPLPPVLEGASAPEIPRPSRAPAAPASRSDRSEPPLWSGRIRPIAEVGRGAMATVLRATDIKLRRDLAIKVTPKARHDLPSSQLARFVEEAQITAQLEHPNVVPVHDLGVDPDGRAYFSMKLVRGQSLESILTKREKGDEATLSEFGLRRLLEVFLQVCQGVDYAHARGVIHRDLKPANIMVGDFGEVLVMDWGVAKLKGRPDVHDPQPAAELTSVRGDNNEAFATQLGAVLGTPAYMSPEQALGKDVDERTDVYALGVILYEILCGDVPFNAPDPVHLLARACSEEPPAPSTRRKDVPLALEALVLRMLAKDPDKRTLTIRQIRSLVQDYIDGIGHEYRRETIAENALWLGGATLLFAFLVWYLTGQSVATVVALTPGAAFNALGWMLLIMAAGYPLWAVTTAVRVGRGERDPFHPATEDEMFVAGYLAHRTRAATIAPLFQLVFLVQIVGAAVYEVTRGGTRPSRTAPAIVAELRAEWAHALIVILVFLFAYLLLVSREVRFARRLDRYAVLVRRARWESAWPTFLMVVLVSTVLLGDVLGRVLSDDAPLGAFALRYLRERFLPAHLDLFELMKTLVFQGTFLLGLVVTAIVSSFPFAEILASLRLAYQPADDASVGARKQYFLRSLALFRLAALNWLYGGAMIGSLTAVTLLSRPSDKALVEQLVTILGPSLIGFAGFALARRYARAYVERAPAVSRMLVAQAAVVDAELTRASAVVLARAAWRRIVAQLVVPLACIVAYLLWSGSGIHQHALRRLMVPVSTQGWLLILPYVLLIPLLLVRDRLQLRLIARREAAFARSSP